MVAAASSTRCICVLPMVVAESIAGRAGRLVAIPLADAAPARCTLAWRGSNESALTAALAEIAGEVHADGEITPIAA